MSASFEHGTDCFEVEAFLHRNEVSKLFKVRHKATGLLYCMEVVPKKTDYQGPINTRVQETADGLSKFWVNLKFTFQTNSKLYYILEYIGERTLGSVYDNNGPFTEDLVIFYTSEIVVALEEFHSNGLVYGELDLEKVFLDQTGHVVLWRNFCGKTYWSRRECLCSLKGFRRGIPCENLHGKISERESKIDFQLLGLIVLQLFSKDKMTSMFNDKTTRQDRLLCLGSKADLLPSTLSVFARDLVTRLLKGQFYNSQHLRSHPFFNGVNWKMVKARLTTPPTIANKTLHPPRLRKTSSEAYIRPQTPVLMNEDYLCPPYQVRPSSTPIDYSNTRGRFADQSLGTSYPQYTPYGAPPRLRSTLSSPDLTSFGQEMSDNQWTRDRYGYRAGIPRSYPVDRYSYGEFSPLESPRNRYGLSHSLTDLTNIGDYEDQNEPPSRLYGRPRTSSLTDLTGGQYDDYARRPPPLTTRQSFPPRDSNYMERINTRNMLVNHEDDDYRRVYGHGRNSHVLPSNKYIDRHGQYLDSRQSQSYPSTLYTGPVSSFYKEYSRGDFGRYSNEDFEIGGRYRLRRNSSTSDLRSINAVEDSPREIYSRTSSDENYWENFGGFSTLQRSRSCSDLNTSDNDESKGNTHTASSTNERRQNYPLAQIPIPSFEEFKRKNSTQSIDEDVRALEREKLKEKHDFRPLNIYKNKKAEENSEGDLSSKDKVRSTNFLTSKYSRERRGSRDAFKSRSDPAGSRVREKSTENVKESYYSQNDVIHNLMLKYGLYERSEKKKEPGGSVAKEERLEINSAKIKEFDSLLNTKKDGQSKVNGYAEVESSVRRPRIGRRASAVHHRDPPRLTHKSYSSLSPSTALQLSSDQNNNTNHTNNLKINGVEDKNKKENIYDNSMKSRIRKEELKSKLFDSAPQVTPEITIADVYKSTKHRKSLTPDSAEAQSIYSQDKDLPVDKESEKTQTKSSKTLWAAAKDRLKLRKSPNSSPRLRRKEEDKVETENESNYEQSDGKASSTMREEKKDDNMEHSKRRLSREELNRLKFSRDFAKEDAIAKRKVSTDSSSQGQLRRNGVHSSLLSITSSLYSTDIDLDDSGSWNSELDGSESSRMGNKRWESFHSNISADSGSAHMYEFETDSIAAEMEDGNQEIQEQLGSEIRKKSDAEVERTDSGIGGDIGVDHNHKRNWEDIVLKSSRHWSVVAASARHWQDMARRNKNSKEIVSKKMKNIAPVITEDMVECSDCQKFYVPEDKSGGQDVFKESSHTTDASICAKCKERRVERKEAIIELVQTEINYGNDLQILKEEFYSPLQSGGILQPDNLAEIFLNLQELVEVSTKFSRRIQNGLEVSVSKGDEEFSHVNVGSIFLESVDLFQSYEIYCSKQNSASALLESLQKKNELLKIFLNVTCRENPKCRKMDLNSFLLAPVQRIMKYPLLLSRIRKSTPRRNPDRDKLMQAQKKIEDQLNRINALNSSVEPKQRRYRGSGHLGRSDSLDKLQMKKMAGDILNWTLSELHLLMHGVFEVMIYEFASSGGWNRRGSKRAADVFMLFCVRGLSEPETIDSDEDNALEEPFFPSDSEATDAALVMLRKKMNGKYTLFKEPLSLDTCIICRDSEYKDSFEIINMSRETYVFKANGSKESKKWLKHLRLQAKDLGMWKKRRNGLPNIMIKNI